MNLINDIDQLYDINIRHHQNMRGTFTCPVCNATLSSESTFKTHLEAKGCYDLKSLVKGTTLEDTAFKWYTEVAEADKGVTIHNVTQFRKNRQYNTFIQTIVFCSQHREHRHTQYLAFTMLVKKYKTINGAMKAMRKESTLREFRLFLQVNDEIDDSVFVSQHEMELKTDHHFLVRSIERSDLSIQTFLTWDIEMIMKDMPVDYKDRIKLIASNL